MLREEFRQLHSKATTQLCQGSVEKESVLVQIYNIALGKNNKLACFISDGRHCVKAFLQEKDLLLPQKHQNAIIRIKEHVVANSGKTVGILEFDLVCEYEQIIGNPQPLAENMMMDNNEENKVYLIDPKHIKTNIANMLEEKGKPLNESSNSKSGGKTEVKEEFKEVRQQKKGVNKEVRQERRGDKKEMRVPDVKPLNGSVKDYQTIKGLFVGLKNWHLLCRITKLDYQQFKKKNADKLVKLLTIELMDRSDIKILGYFFYEAAEKFKNQLKVNSVYKISDGGIDNESYNNTKNDKFSPFKLMFHTTSVFEEVSDVQIIAKSQDSAITLGEVLKRSICDQEFDILGVLVEIEEPKEFTKGDKQLKRWNWVIVDPIQEKTIHAVFWHDKFKDSSLIGKTIILSRFTLHNYNGSLTLSSRARSTILLANYPPYQELQGQAIRDYKNYELLSALKAKEEENGQGTIFHNFRDLNTAINTLSGGETLRSDMIIYVNRLIMKKWYYDGCPQCNKNAEKGVTCHCGKYVQQTIPHFIMPAELADGFGSLYSTAYDEQAKKIFWDEAGVIYKLMKFDEKQIKDVVEDYYFQEFKVRLYTKKDNEGRIKHNMGRLEPVIPQKVAMENVEKIRELMGR